MTSVTLPVSIQWLSRVAHCYVGAASAPRGDVAGEQVMQGKTLSKICCFLLVSGVALGQATLQNAKDDSQQTKLVVMEHLWNEAQVNRDSRALDGMLGDNFTNTEYDGEVSDKAKFLADIRDPLFNLQTLTIQDVKVSMYGDAGVVFGIYHTKGTYQGKPYDHFGRFTDTWVFAQGHWQCVASHTSLLKK